MKLGAYVCQACGSGVDTDDPVWVSTKDGYYHTSPDRRFCGVAVLKRSQDREAAIADERAFMQSKQPELQAAMDASRRRRLAAEVGGRPVR